MNINLRLSFEDVTNLIGEMASWGSAVPHQPKNLEKLAMWRMVLGQMSIEDRAQLALHEPFFKKAIFFTPKPDSDPGRSRSLDWDRLANAQQPQHAELLAEEARWIEAGLLSQRPWSSSEWPAVALLEACHQTHTALPHLESSLWTAVDRRTPGILQALLPLASTLDWEAFLDVPLPNYYPPITRLGRVTSPDVPEISNLLGPFLTPPIVAKIGEGRGGLFHAHFLPPEQVDAWVRRGANPAQRDDLGRYAEETWAFRPVVEVKAYHQALAPYRSAAENTAAWTRTCWELLMRQPLESLKSAGVVEHLLGAPDSAVGQPAAHLLTLVVRDHQNIAGEVAAKNWASICKEVASGTKEGARWTMCLGGTNAIHGLVLGLSVVLDDDFRRAGGSKIFQSMQVANGEEALLVGLEKTAEKAVKRSNYALENAGVENWARMPIQQLERWQPIVGTILDSLVMWMEYDHRNRRETLDSSEAPLGWMKLANAIALAKPEIARDSHWAPVLLLTGLIVAEARRDSHCDIPALPALDGIPKNLDVLPEAREWLAECPPAAQLWLSKYAPNISALVREKMLNSSLPEPTPAGPKTPRF